MWLDGKQIQAVDLAVQGTRCEQVDDIIRSIFNAQVTPDQKLASCPICKSELIQKTLPFVELFVSACPQQHGVWMSPENSKKFQEFLKEHVSIAASRKYNLKVLNRVVFLSLVVAGLFLVSRVAPEYFSNLINKIQLQATGSKISTTYWPNRNFTNWYPLPVKDSVIDYQDELVYFQNVFHSLEQGIDNRLNLDAALQSKRPASDYEELGQYYRTKQFEVLEELRKMQVPQKWAAFHEHLIIATREQIAFYEDYVSQKTNDVSTSLNQLLANSHLTVSNQHLHTAYDLFKSTLGQVDHATDQAMYNRLCWFDII